MVKVTLVEKCKLPRRQLFFSSPFRGCFRMTPPLRASGTYISYEGTAPPFFHPRVCFHRSSAVPQLPSRLLLGVTQLGGWTVTAFLGCFGIDAGRRAFYVLAPIMSAWPLLSACSVYPAAHYLRLACQNRLNSLWEIWSHP